MKDKEMDGALGDATEHAMFSLALERIERIASLLLELGRDGNNATEPELVLGCRDSARILSDEVLPALRRSMLRP